MIPFPEISPELFSFNIFGLNITLRWYAISYILGFACALAIMKNFIRKHQLWTEKGPPFDSDQAESFLTYLIMGVIIGGRLGYVLFYNFDYFSNNPFAILRVWEGGMAFHGGFLGVVAAVIFYAAINRLSLWSCADLIAVSTPPGLLFGRLANFINNELWGRPTSMPWGVTFPGDKAQNCAGVKSGLDALCARHPTQLYEAGLEGLFMFVVLVFCASKGAFKLPGLITGLFSLIYGSARFLVEYYRVPDAQFFSQENPFGYAYMFGNFGLTMGQSLSLPMIVFGLFLIFRAMLLQKKSKDKLA